MREADMFIRTILITSISLVLGQAQLLKAEAQEATTQAEPIVAMYVHQHWPYNHPYAARTWTVEDWRGYLDGLHRLGFNAVVIWPVLETMPEPLTPSDRENLLKIARVIDLAHAEFRMRVYVVLCSNVIADSATAGQATFEHRHFFHSDIRINPAEPEAVELMIQRRSKLLARLAGMDGLFIIDSDPGGYPGSTNAEFVFLLVEHRKLLDRIRPGIELIYWMWAGWPAYARYYESGHFEWGKPEEFDEALSLIEAEDLEPWGIACTVQRARRIGRSERVLLLQYGAIEGEPTMPITNFGSDQAYNAGRAAALRGVVGNAQTHCVQLPNTFAFSRGATGRPLPTDADYLQFANDLIVGQGDLILAAWEAIGSNEPARQRELADRLEKVADGSLLPGPLKGLLFGSPRRFMRDLMFQLRYQAAMAELTAAVDAGADTRPPLARYLTALEDWYGQHGYKNTWAWQVGPLSRLKNERIDQVLAPSLRAATPFGRVKENLALAETFTPRMIEAIRRTLDLPAGDANK